MNKIIDLSNITKVYGKGEARVIALKEINLNIEEGELVAIIGPSGSGKSTLLNILGYLDRPTSGEYLFMDNNINDLSERKIAKIRNTRIGFVLQNFALLPQYSVYENINIPLELSKIKKKESKTRIKEMLIKLGIEDKLKKYPPQLSGGQNQRVAIARALINNPSLILADEPTGSLDQNTSQEVIDILKELNREGKTVIIVTHNQNIANQCDRIISIIDGHIVSDKTKERR
jgi:putative ABC transport system ATP-binding protein